MAFTSGVNSQASWDNSFNEILSRTRDNISRISARYPDSDLSAARNLYGSSKSAIPMQSLTPPRSSKTSGQLAQNVTIDAGTLNQLLDRMDKLESNANSGSSASLDHRVVVLEKALDAMQQKLESTTNELGDANRANIALNNQLTRQGGLIEVLQQEIDSRRSVVSRMDAWARQGEVWREDIENQINSLNRHVKDAKRVVSEQQGSLGDVATKLEVEQLKDKVQLVAQHTVAASMSVWHDKIDSSVRQVERQVAALRIGRTLDDDVPMSDKDVQDALQTKQPSELMVHGMVSSQLRETEERLEKTISGHIRHEIRAEQADMLKSLRKESERSFAQLAAEMGLVSESGPGNDTARKIISSKKALEREVESLLRKHEDVSAAVMVLQEGLDSAEKHRAQEHRSLERRVDETVAVSSSHVQTIQSRCAGLEDLVRSTDLAHRTALQANRDEVAERIRSSTSGWTDDRASLDRRLLMVEKTAEDLVDRLKTSNSAIDAYFTGSAEGRRLQAAAARTEVLQADVQNLKTDSRDLSQTLAKLEASSADKHEYNELRNRFNRIEGMTDTIRRLESQVSREQEHGAQFTDQLISLEQAITALTNGSSTLTERFTTMEKSVNSNQEDLTKDKESIKMLSMRIEQLDENLSEQIDDNAAHFGKSVSTFSDRVAALQDQLHNLQESSSTKTKHLEDRLEDTYADLNARMDVHFAGPAKDRGSPAEGLPPKPKRTPSPHIDVELQRASSNRTPSPKPAKPMRSKTPSPDSVKPEAKTLTEVYELAEPVSSAAPAAAAAAAPAPAAPAAAPAPAAHSEMSDDSFEFTDATDARSPMRFEQEKEASNASPLSSPMPEGSSFDEFDKSGVTDESFKSAQGRPVATPDADKSASSNKSADEVSPFPALADSPVKTSKGLLVPKLTLPVRGEDDDEAWPAPLSRGNGDGSFKEEPAKEEPAQEVIDSAAKDHSDHPDHPDHPKKPVKPVKATKPVSTTPSSPMVAGEATPNKALTTKERLKLRQEALKRKKESATKAPKPASPSPVKKSAGDDLVESFESYEDSFES